MIAIKSAKNEIRKRDKKRNRIIITIGNQSWHITRAEAKILKRRLMSFNFDFDNVEKNWKVKKKKKEKENG